MFITFKQADTCKNEKKNTEFCVHTVKAKSFFNIWRFYDYTRGLCSWGLIVARPIDTVTTLVIIMSIVNFWAHVDTGLWYQTEQSSQLRSVDRQLIASTWVDGPISWPEINFHVTA